MVFKIRRNATKGSLIKIARRRPYMMTDLGLQLKAKYLWHSVRIIEMLFGS